ncbi:gliding motility lipoprotein GldB [Pontibacter arcticus]|uniref:Gliding motility lipoprotein GldB n=2 Tax=Pontibacter arcticus TaxID=2080288 RepID=A0A364RBA5_9BACT|nr:gliding motility lipoprotein GldB [Pontibacter arcticus]
MYYRIIVSLILLLSFGCREKGCQLPEEIAKVPVTVQVERLEEGFFATKSQQEMAAFIDQNKFFADTYLERAKYKSDSMLVRPLFLMSENPSLDTLAKQAAATFGDFKQEQQQLETAFKVIKYHYPAYKTPQVKTFVTGLGSMGSDLFVSDSMLVFGLDYFIGKKASYRPQVYEYILQRYEKDKMVPAAMLLLSNNFNKTNPADRTMLAEMLNVGKAYYFVKSVMPCVADSSIIGYTGQQVADIRYNEGKIWAHFIEKGLLFEKNPFQVNKYIGERPNTPEIDAKSPGRLGTWVGWQIVNKYMERNPEVTLPQLMAETDYQKIFDQSKYKPERRK